MKSHRWTMAEMREFYSDDDLDSGHVLAAGQVVVDKERFVRWEIKDPWAPTRRRRTRGHLHYTISWFTRQDAGDWVRRAGAGQRARDLIAAATAEARTVARALERDGTPEAAMIALGVLLEEPPAPGRTVH